MVKPSPEISAAAEECVQQDAKPREEQKPQRQICREHGVPEGSRAHVQKHADALRLLEHSTAVGVDDDFEYVINDVVDVDSRMSQLEERVGSIERKIDRDEDDGGRGGGGGGG
eukprot:scaffold54771_cov54-Phaeocystis_antarctica.AAC.1